MARKTPQKKQWFCITYDTKNESLFVYVGCTYQEFEKYLSIYERKYSNVTWHYCDNPL